MSAPALPLVSVICLSYNHAPFVKEALESVLGQTYPNIELIVVDDASTDHSREEIEAFIASRRHIKFMPLPKNMGNCKAFNLGFRESKGAFLVDLAADDIMLPNRIEKQVKLLNERGNNFGVAFSDAYLVNPEGEIQSTYYKKEEKVNMREGDVYEKLLGRQFICTPTMLMRREVLEDLGGYDENLVYEDFDFWVRSGRKYHYAFSEEILTSKRILPHSHGKGFYGKNAAPYLHSTIKVCQKARKLNKNQAEHNALAWSVRYYMRLCFFTENFALCHNFWHLLRKITKPKPLDYFFVKISALKLPAFRVYQMYRYCRNFLSSVFKMQ